MSRGWWRGLLVALLAAGSASASDEVPTPSTEELGQSVSVVDLDGSVSAFDLDGSVTSVETERQEAGETVLSLASDILFAFGSFQLPPQATARIGELVAPLPQGAPVAVTGHTDSIGQPAANLALSQQRAQAVADAVAAARPDLPLTVGGRGRHAAARPQHDGRPGRPGGPRLQPTGRGALRGLTSHATAAPDRLAE